MAPISNALGVKLVRLGRSMKTAW